MEQFKIRDASSYDAVAEHFDRFTNIVTKPLARTMVRLARLQSGDRILDVGTGSGIVAIHAAEMAASVRIVGIDLSDGLLSMARQNVKRAGLVSGVRFVKGDAEVLPFEDASFDCVVSLFALLHFPHPNLAVAEMHRVLKPRGRLVIGIGAAPPWNWQGLLHRMGRIRDLLQLRTGDLLIAPSHLNAIVSEYVPAGSDSEETELAQRHAARADTAVDLVRELGLTDVETYWEGHHLVLDDAQEFWDLQSTFSSFSRKRLGSASDLQAKLVRDRFDGDCERVLSRGGKLVYHYAGYFVSGRRRS